MVNGGPRTDPDWSSPECSLGGTTWHKHSPRLQQNGQVRMECLTEGFTDQLDNEVSQQR
jgi:hypothetical protein